MAAAVVDVALVVAQRIDVGCRPRLAAREVELAVDGEQHRDAGHRERLVALDRGERPREAVAHRLVHDRLGAVVQVVAEGPLAEVVVRAGHEDHLVPRDVDRVRGHAERRLGAGPEAGQVPLAQSLQGDVDRTVGVELLAELVLERHRELVALDEGPAAAAGRELHAVMVGARARCSQPPSVAFSTPSRAG